jgi:hypothetical protein
MTVFLLIREDQNEHGYIDTSIDGVFHEVADAKARERSEMQRALAEGLLVEEVNCGDADWQVCWRVESHALA